MNDCEQMIEAGAYVLHALEAREAEDYALHLEDCADCRVEVARLSAVVDTLPVGVPQFAAPASLKRSVMSVVEGEAELLNAAIATPDKVGRPRRTWWSRVRLAPALAGGLACALIALGIGVGVSFRDDAAAPVVRTVAAQDAPAGARVRFEVADDGHTDLVMAGMPAAPKGKVWQVWRMDARNRITPTRTLFTTPSDGSARVQVDGGVRPGTRLLVSAERPGGAQTPTSAPVITVAL